MERADLEGSLAAHTPPPQPQGLDDYRVLRELGRGGCGAVYLAVDRRTDRLVALKIPRGLEDVEQHVRFVREAYALAAVRSDNVVAVHVVGTHRRRPFYVMEYVPGGSLHDRVAARGRLPDDEVRSLLRGLLRGLAAVHDHALVHRDVKPTNVGLRAGGTCEPVLLDFGLARLEQDLGLTDPNLLMGTPEYLPPETIREGVFDRRGDLYAAGLTVRYAVDGCTPFSHLEGLALLETASFGPGPVVSRHLQPELAQLLTLLTERRPEDRPASAAEALAWLDAIEPSSSEAPSRRVPKRRPFDGLA